MQLLFQQTGIQANHSDDFYIYNNNKNNNSKEIIKKKSPTIEEPY